jgi:hypothetical protein
MRTSLLLLSEVGTANEMQKIEPCDPVENNKQEETEVRLIFTHQLYSLCEILLL